MTADSSDDHALTVMRIADGVQRIVLELPKAEGWTAFQDWTADGRYLVYTQVTGRGPRSSWVWRVPFEGGDTLRTELQIGTFSGWIRISNGTHFAFTEHADFKATVSMLENFLPR